MWNDVVQWARGARAGRRVLLLAAILVEVTALVFPAWAKPSAEELAVARQLFDKAVAAEGRNAWAECEEALSEAIGIVETPGLRFHQAHCKEQQNKWVEALVDYKRAEELLQGGVKASDVEPLLEPALTRLESKVPRLTVVVAQAPEQLTFYLDGKERSAKLLGKPVQLNPGSHSIEISASGYEALVKNVSIKEGERSELRLSLRPKDETARPSLERGSERAYEPTKAIRERGSKPMSAKPFVLVGEGAIAAVLFGLSVKFYSDKQDFSASKQGKLGQLAGKSCAGVDPPRECEQLRKVADNEKRSGEYALYTAIGGAAAVAILATTWLAWDDSPRVVVAYDPSAGVASFTLNGTF